MGQKTTPTAIRLQLNKNWTSKWFSDKRFKDQLTEDLLLKKTVQKKLGRNVGINRIDIQRSAQEIKIIIQTSKPGIIIGRNGQGISNLKKMLNKVLELHRQKTDRIKSWTIKNYKKLKIIKDKIDIEVTEIREPEIYARLVAQNITHQLEKRISYRRAIKQAIARSAQNSKLLGIRVAIAGRLNGVEIARHEKFIDGSIPLSKFKANLDYASENAYTTYGVIGIKVWIYKKKEKMGIEI